MGGRIEWYKGVKGYSPMSGLEERGYSYSLIFSIIAPKRGQQSKRGEYPGSKGVSHILERGLKPPFSTLFFWEQGWGYPTVGGFPLLEKIFFPFLCVFLFPRGEYLDGVPFLG